MHFISGKGIRADLSPVLLVFLLGACAVPPQGPATPGSASARAAERVGELATGAREVAETAHRIQAHCDPETRERPFTDKDLEILEIELGALQQQVGTLREQGRVIHEMARAAAEPP